MRLVFFVFLLLLLHLPACYAQQQDFQTWSSVTLKKTFSDKFECAAQEQLRLQDNSTRLKQLFTDVGIKYNATKQFHIGFNYRFIVKPQEIDNRIYSDIAYDFRQNNTKATARIRLQHDFVQNAPDQNYIRPKLTVEQKLNRHWKPFVSGELFLLAFYYEGSEFDEYRISLGTTYNFDKKNSVQVFYMLQQQFNVNDAEQNHILGVGYEYDL